MSNQRSATLFLSEMNGAFLRRLALEPSRHTPARLYEDSVPSISIVDLRSSCGAVALTSGDVLLGFREPDVPCCHPRLVQLRQLASRSMTLALKADSRPRPVPFELLDDPRRDEQTPAGPGTSGPQGDDPFWPSSSSPAWHIKPQDVPISRLSMDHMLRPQPRCLTSSSLATLIPDFATTFALTGH